MYIVQQGEVEVLLHDTSIDTVGPGGVVGEMGLIDASPRSATVMAKTSCTLVPVDQKRFTYLVQQTPYFALYVMGVMASRLRRLHTQI
jgi:CRP/FNR family transcriptional regulator, cyclic AMP receptor protein